MTHNGDRKPDLQEIEMHMDGRRHQRPMDLELQQRIYVRVDCKDFTQYLPSDISTEPLIVP